MKTFLLSLGIDSKENGEQAKNSRIRTRTRTNQERRCRETGRSIERHGRTLSLRIREGRQANPARRNRAERLLYPQLVKL